MGGYLGRIECSHSSFRPIVGHLWHPTLRPPSDRVPIVLSIATVSYV